MSTKGLLIPLKEETWEQWHQPWEKWVEERNKERDAEFKGVGKLGVVKNSLLTKDHAKPLQAPLRKRQPLAVKEVTIGITFRTESEGTAHTGHDKEGFKGLNTLGAKLREMGRPFPVVIAETLPKGASGPVTPDRDAKFADLDGIDLLYIPGSPYAADMQVGGNQKDADLQRTRDPGPQPEHPGEGASPRQIEKYQNQLSEWTNQKRKHVEHTSRAPYELRLIEIARTRGIPVMAICAGAWRLLESFGGQSRTIDVQIRGTHKKSGNVWEGHHHIDVTGNTMLSQAMGFEKRQDGRWPKMQTVQNIDAQNFGSLTPRQPGITSLQDANTTHWAAADVDQQGRLVKNPLQEQRDHRGLIVQRADNPSSLLQVTAKAPDGVVESFETLFGAPCMALQWHPECYLPGMLGFDAASAEQKNTSQGIFEFMVFAAVASRLRRGFVIGTLDMEKTAFSKLMTETKALFVDLIRNPALTTAAGRVEECLTQTLALMPGEALWSVRMDEMAAALKWTLQPAMHEKVRATLLKHGVVV